MSRPARVLIVAGSDSGGGAGIQGDIKTATALGAYAMTAITAVTVQNTNGVSRSFPIPSDVISEQIQAVMSDIGADAIKTGMLVSGGVIAAVADAMKGYADLPIVVDPVMTAKDGASLLDDPGVHALKAHLFPIAALVTPNIPEAERLTGVHILTEDDMVAAGETLRDFGARAVLIKGGHLSGDTVTDVLVSKSGVHRFSAGRLRNRSTHGTGCALATATATCLAQGMPLVRAVEKAREFVRSAIGAGFPLGHGTAPINHLHALR
jgi:hydroxymethylpyrimidine/phosphomethylpyrimidine kinase